MRQAAAGRPGATGHTEFQRQQAQQTAGQDTAFEEDVGPALGAKGAEEAGTAGTPAAVMNAIHDALAPFKTRVASPPITPQKIQRTLGQVGPGPRRQADGRLAGR